MSRPKHEGGPLRQVATWVPDDLKRDLEQRAADEKKPERAVVTDALTAHLRAASVRKARRSRSED